MMTHIEAQQRSERLKWISQLSSQLSASDVHDWLAFCEDELKLMFPDRPQLLGRFAELKEEATRTNNVQGDENVFLTEIKGFVDQVRTWLNSEPLTKQDLDEREIERILLKSRLVQIPLMLIGVLLFLITGVGGFKLWDQFKAGQALLQDTRRQMQETNLEAAKARAETNNREAELAQFILQGNEKIVTMQTAAINQMETEGEQFKKDVGKRAVQWINEVDNVGPGAKQQVIDAGAAGAKTVTEETASSLQEFDAVVKGNKKTLQDKLAEAIAQLERARHPWVSRVIVWSFAKVWVLAPVALFSSLLALAGNLLALRESKIWSRNLAVLNTLLLIAVVVVLLWQG